MVNNKCGIILKPSTIQRLFFCFSMWSNAARQHKAFWSKWKPTGNHSHLKDKRWCHSFTLFHLKLIKVSLKGNFLCSRFQTYLQKLSGGFSSTTFFNEASEMKDRVPVAIIWNPLSLALTRQYVRVKLLFSLFSFISNTNRTTICNLGSCRVEGFFRLSAWITCFPVGYRIRHEDFVIAT